MTMKSVAANTTLLADNLQLNKQSRARRINTLSMELRGMWICHIIKF